jgi:CelD/BcsL family acetyltransferase involved in cellulose biosynthesis
LIRVETLRPEFTENYEQYLLRHPGSLIYYSSKYKNFIEALLGCEEEYLLALEEAEIRGVLPLMFIETARGRVYNSLPFYGSNGGVLADSAEANDSLIEAYNGIALRSDTLSATIIINPFVRQDARAIEHNHSDYRIGQFTNISFQTDAWNQILERIDSSGRRNIQKATREGVTVEIDLSAMERLRQLHQANIEALGGLAKAQEFFDLIPRHFTPGEDYDIYVARIDGLIIAGLLLFYFNQTVEYITPVIDHEYRSLQPLSLVLITAMRDASERGFTCWNWGGTWVSQTGVYRFKKKWAAAEQEYRYYTQLNDLSILEWPQAKIVSTFPGFYIAPFSALKSQGETG